MSGELSVTVSGLPNLGHDRYYEVWLGIDADALRHGSERISAGQFVVNADGSIASPDGGPAAFGVADAAELEHASEVLVTVESTGAEAPGPALLGGEIVRVGEDAHADLTSAYHEAVGVDLAAASGSFVLATPTDGEGDDENQGLWFTDAAGAAALSLPTLNPGWIYHAHIIHGGHSHSVGTFSSANVADSDGAGTEAGAQAAFTAPGSDFLVSALDLADGATTTFIVIEPSGDLHPEGLTLRHDSSFPMRILQTVIPLDSPVRTPIALGPGTPLPTATVSFTR